MRKFVLWTLLGLLIGNTAIAAEQPGIGYVNLQAVLVNSKVGKRNKMELDKLIAQKKSSLSAAEEKLKAMQEAYKKDQLLMTDDQKKAKEKEYQEKVRAYQQMVDTANQAVNSKGNEFAESSLAQIKPIVARIAKEMKIGIVFDANDLSVLYAEKGMDLTQKVIEQYDAKTK